jgi:hypothetical protein
MKRSEGEIGVIRHVYAKGVLFEIKEQRLGGLE